MPKFVLFGVKSSSLDEARALTEDALGLILEKREGLQSGGIHYTLIQPLKYIDLKNNLDLDDDEMEVGGRSEPVFPTHPFLLYLNHTDQRPELLTKVQARPDWFEKLRES